MSYVRVYRYKLAVEKDRDSIFTTITTISHMETMLKRHTVTRTSIHWHVYNDKALYNDRNTFLTLQILFPISGI